MPFLRNSLDFAFDSELIMQAAYFDLRILRGAGDMQIFRGRLVSRFRAGTRLRR